MSKLFVFDTVILIRAALSKYSNAFSCIEKADANGTLICSDETFEEFERKIMLPKFDKYALRTRRKYFLDSYGRRALNIPIKTKIIACRDPKDDKFLSLAVSADADCIITLDEDLLVLNPFQNIPIITPGVFLSMKL
jgi:uncharacterized protein